MKIQCLAVAGLLAIKTANASPFNGHRFECPDVGAEPLVLTMNTTIPQQVELPISSNLCTLAKVDAGNRRTPVGRSYDGNDWEVSAGYFSARVSIDACYEGLYCHVTLPALPTPLEGQEAHVYMLSSFQHSISPQAQVARFLEQATFGPTLEEIQSTTSDAFHSWIESQITHPPSSHREFYRQRTNPKWEFPTYNGAVGPCACEVHSRWRTYALTSRDYLEDRVLLKQKVLTIESLNNDGNAPFVWYVEGHARTVVEELGEVTDGNGNFIEDIVEGTRYFLAYNAQTWKADCVGCKVVVSKSVGSTEYLIAGGNPVVNITGIENTAKLPYTTVTLPEANLLNMDTGADLGPVFQNFYKPNESWMLTDASSLDTAQCENHPSIHQLVESSDSLTDHPAANLPTVFGTTTINGQIATLAFDPHLALHENTVENPNSDGGGKLMMDTTGVAADRPVKCANVPRSFINEQHCKLSHESTACSPNSEADPVIILEESSLQGIFELTGLYVYSIDGLPITNETVSDGGTGTYLTKPCQAQSWSRWMRVSDPGCIPTVGPITQAIFQALLEYKTNSDAESYNADLKDVRRYYKSCDAEDVDLWDLGLIQDSAGTCWKHVHPKHLNVYDLTNFITGESNHTAGNHSFLSELAETGQFVLSFPNDAAHAAANQKFFDTIVNHPEFYPVLGKLGDHILYDDLPVDLQTEEIRDAFQTHSINPAGDGVVICGSVGEVASDPLLGDSGFDARTDARGNRNYRVSSIWEFSGQRHTVWAYLALYAQDQLRQKMAWSLSQIVAVGVPRVFHDLAEPWIVFYDIFVRNAFGNYRDILKEISFAGIMGDWLSFTNNKSLQYQLDTYGNENYPDENFAREIMQLFSVGLYHLNMDGTQILDENGDAEETYSIEEIQSYARVWTGFVKAPDRGGNEGGVDPMNLERQYRDLFPKIDLEGGYIGDRYPLCADLPSKHFLRKGGTYRLMGAKVSPDLQYDHSDWEHNAELNRLELETSSPLYEKLCAAANGECTFPGMVTLSENLVYDEAAKLGEEYEVDTIRTVRVKPLPGGIHYEYVQPPCVDQAFFNGGVKVVKGQIWGDLQVTDSMCADPRRQVATEMCCESGWESGGEWGKRFCHYHGERMSFDSATNICAENGMEQCNPWRSSEANAGVCGLGTKHGRYFSWAKVGCATKIKVLFESGNIAIVHYPEPDFADLRQTSPLVSVDTQNYFPAIWDGEYPSIESCNATASCTTLDDSCLCESTVAESAAYATATDISSADDLLSTLHVGSFQPDMFDSGDYTSLGDCGVPSLTVYADGGDCSFFGPNTIFHVQDTNGVDFFLKNIVSSVRIAGSEFSFRNPVHFVSLVDPELRDMYHETDAVLDSLFFHPSHPPFLALRLIQRFGISNPSPRYIESVASAYKEGSYQGIGSGSYGDLGAITAAILLDRESRSVSLDADQSHGHLREPLIKVLSFFRSMGVEYTSPLHVPMMLDMAQDIGQGSYEIPSVFSFFTPEFVPSGVVEYAGLVAPEAMLLTSDKVTTIIDSFFTTVKFGVVDCFPNSFGKRVWRNGNPMGCPTGEGDTSNAQAMITYTPSSTVNVDEILDELSLLLTASRLGDSNRNLIKSQIEPEFAGGNIEKAIRIAQQLISSTPEFHSTNLARNSNNEREVSGYTASPKGSYKAIVYFMMSGGVDSFNMLVPKGNCTGPDMYEEYRLARGEVHSIPTSELLEIDATGSGQGCDTFGVHPSFPILAELYNANDALFFANAGVLGQPMTKDTFTQMKTVRLFDHATMQKQAKTVDPMKENTGTGVAGRILDLLKRVGYQTSSNSVNSNSEFAKGDQVDNNPVITVSTRNLATLDPYSSLPDTNMLDVVKQLNGVGNSENSLFGETWSSRVATALHEHEKMHELNAIQNFTIVDYPVTSGLDSAFKAIAEFMRSREYRKVNREAYFVEQGGYDGHSYDSLPDLFPTANVALTNFVNELKAQGVWENTVIIMGSDFGRTITVNSNSGTDHAWGGNYFMLGGGVQGGKILGEYPQPLSSESSQWLNRGRLIPTTPWESIWNGVAQWMGVRGDLSLDWALPNRDSWDKCSMFTDQDLFVEGEVSSSTCSERDSDGDGIADVNDQCNDTPYHFIPHIFGDGCSPDSMYPTTSPTTSPTESQTPTMIHSSAPSPLPSTSPTVQCERNFIDNGDAETLSGWGRRGGSGISLTQGFSGNGIQVTGRGSNSNGPQQLMNSGDLGCLTVGSVLSISFKVKLYNETTGGPDTYCSATSPSGDCPRLGLRQEFPGTNLWTWLSDSNMLENWDSSGWNTFERLYVIDRDWSAHIGETGYKFEILFAGGMPGTVIVVDDVLVDLEEPSMSPTLRPSASPSDRPSGSPSISPSSLPSAAPSDRPSVSPTGSQSPSIAPTVQCERNFIDDNGENLDNWFKLGGTMTSVPGSSDGQRIEAAGRTSWRSGPGQNLNSGDLGCLSIGTVIKFSFKAKLYNETTGEPDMSCADGANWRDCPLVATREWFPEEWDNHKWIYHNDWGMNNNWDLTGGWNTYEKFYTLPRDWSVHAHNDTYTFQVFYVGGKPGTVLVLDEVVMDVEEPSLSPTLLPSAPPTNVHSLVPSQSMQPSTAICARNLFDNSEAESTAGWKRRGGSGPTLYPGFSGNALQVKSRTKWHHGIGQRMDATDLGCLTIGTVIQFSAKVKLYNEASGEPDTFCAAASSGASTDCPRLGLRHEFPAEALPNWTWILDVGAMHQNWDPSGWNTYEGTYTVNRDWASHVGETDFWMDLFFIGGRVGTAIVIDDAVATIISQP